LHRLLCSLGIRVTTSCLVEVYQVIQATDLEQLLRPVSPSALLGRFDIAGCFQLLHSLPDGRVNHLKCQAWEDGKLVPDLFALVHAEIGRDAARDVIEQARCRCKLLAYALGIFTTCYTLQKACISTLCNSGLKALDGFVVPVPLERP
jgi:hypothetical protein